MTAGSMFANVAAYLLQVLASRMLGVEGYGEFASLLAAQLVLAVPALALQSVVAREVVRGRSSRELRTVGYRCAAVVGVLALALSPALSAAMDVSMAATVSAVIAAPVLVLLAAEQGLLQGRGRFGALSIVLAAAGFGKVAPAVLVLVLGGGPGSVLLATAAGIGVVALGARWTAGVPVNSVSETKVTVLAVLQASQVQLVLIAMSALDLVLARTLLSSNEAGLYAVGAVASKAAFWLPQAVGVVLYPRMANPLHSAAAVRSALAVVAGLGTVLVIGGALASPLLPLVVGDTYSGVQNYVWLFVLQGACLAVLQSALLWAIAGERTHLAVVAWIALAAEVLLLLFVASTLAQFVTVAAATAAVTMVVVCGLALWGKDISRRRA
ncbi:polysaccharide biosynthesis protein [Rhodococcus sp. 15-725-2-2b]|nr:polysaccharide biosynthesis protein [Rhodococcus sp. 06-469-3-2]OZD40453.1 polysaccharide biosynthesis protein [Rhodococcus sp. 06-1477-1A]OZD86083.1 polysaccharide biosynthesis protein [Rhodococcus sp. 05-339-2]OZE02758.1 polysaccharide biosynthesis protein [Rhodococcus sp. 05-2255-3C]OZE11491.1 polysaccharide biosynthesis protein [Rhodococcus sp. 05-2255-3B1]OZE13215.1 polysaccharide biosynthesis protein [Rhodococcus sp. 05-2255-2A2]OZE75890.1 polysaccharide biosynthesis protein [Rhodoco